MTSAVQLSSNGFHSDTDVELLKNIYDHLTNLEGPSLQHICFPNFVTALTTNTRLRFDILIHICCDLDPGLNGLINPGLGYEEISDQVKLLTGAFSSLGLCRTDDFDLVSGDCAVKLQMYLLGKIFKLLKAIELEKRPADDSEQEENLAKMDATIMRSHVNIITNNSVKNKLVSKKPKRVSTKPNSFPLLEKQVEDLKEQLEAMRSEMKNVVDRGICVCKDTTDDEHAAETKRLATCIGVDCAQAMSAFMEFFDGILQDHMKQEQPKFDIFTKTITKVGPTISNYLKMMEHYQKFKHLHDTAVQCLNEDVGQC